SGRPDPARTAPPPWRVSGGSVYAPVHPDRMEPAMFDDAQRYLFDHQGWITVPGALDPGRLDELNAEFDRQGAGAVAPDANSHRFGDILDWGPAWLNLIDNPRVTDVLEAILGAGFRLDHDYADLIRRGKGPIGTRLHGGATPFDPGQSYAVHDGQ